jgi:hypothetical protein
MKLTTNTAAIWFLFSVVLGTTQFVGPPLAQAASCGGLNQRACPLLKRGPQCGQWLVNVNKFCRPCGGLNQRACPIIAKGPTCKPGLSRKNNRCVKATPTVASKILNDAKRRARQLKPLINRLVALVRTISRSKIGRIKALLKAKNPDDVRKVIESTPDIAATYALMKRLGFNTMTVGIESSGSLGVGYARETGASLDINKRARPRLYVTNSFFGGVIANVGNDIVVSAYQAHNGQISGPALGALGSFDVATGVGITIWYQKTTLRVMGVSVNVGIGNIGAGGAVVDAKTKVY